MVRLECGTVRQVRAIFFDVGGTIVQGAMPWHELYQIALTLSGHPLDLRTMVERYEVAVERMMADKLTAVSADAPKARSFNSHVAEAFGVSRERLQMALDEVLFDHPEARHLVPTEDVATVLAALRLRGYRLGVISNWSADLPLVLSRLELDIHFEAVFASESLGYAKPHPAAFLVPLERMGLTPGESAYVGDLYHVDVVGSREAGLWPVLVDPLELALHDNVATVHRMTELLTVFPGLQ